MDEPSEASSLPRSQPPDFPDHDWIGPVDKRSNLRQICFVQKKDETETERMYRMKREEMYIWNNAFWARHNQNFIEAKEQFVKRALTSTGVGLLDNKGTKQVLSADEMAEFYKEFLQDHHKTLGNYNRTWYRRNTTLLWPAFRVALQRLMRR